MLANSKLQIACRGILAVVLFGLPLLMSGGCSSPPPDPLKGPCGSLSGKVTFNGKPVAERSTITFMGEGGLASSATVEAGGIYEIPKIPVGKYKVAIAMPGMAMDGSLPAGDPTKMGGVEIPTKYMNAETSGETVSIALDEEKTFNLTMKSE